MQGLNKTLGEDVKVFNIFISAGNNLVIDIGNIANIGNIITAVTHLSSNRIKHHQHTRMSQVAEVVNRHTTDIHFHLTGMNRSKAFFFTA